MPTQQTNPESKHSFPNKIWIACGILAFTVVVLLILNATFSVFLLVLAGTLLAVFFRALSSLIQRKTKWKESKKKPLKGMLTTAPYPKVAILWL